MQKNTSYPLFMDTRSNVFITRRHYESTMFVFFLLLSYITPMNANIVVFKFGNSFS